MREEIYWHFRLHKFIYKAALVTLLSVATYLAVIAAIGDRKKSQREVVKQWPTVEVTIVESKVDFLNKSSSTSFGGENYVSLKIKYLSKTTGLEIHTRVQGHWDYRREIGGKDQFKAGQKIKLRVNPDNPKRASLIDITGTI